MGGLQRFIRHGLVISALGHAGLLVMGLLFVWASPHEAVPPDAMLVELVTPTDTPRLSGTPSDLRNSGTDRADAQPVPAPSEPQPKTVPQPPQPKQQRNAQRKPPQEPRAAPAPPQQPPLTSADAAQVAMPPPSDPSTPSAEDTPDAPETAERLAQLALLGGRLGGGFAAPPVDAPRVGQDYTLLFRERVSSCSPVVSGIEPDEKISIAVRLFFNRDGTLAAPPQAREQNLSAKQQALMRSLIIGLEKCQPYTMLPQDRYKQWKTLDLEVYPLTRFGG